jgi:hypothetical protein
VSDDSINASQERVEATSEKPDKQIQAPLGARFSGRLVVTNIEMTSHTLARAPPLLQHEKTIERVQDEVVDQVQSVLASIARTLELSKQLDELLSRPIRWLYPDPDDKPAAIEPGSPRLNTNHFIR